MIIYHIILLAVIQGLTEFLPVSSSAHLGLFHCFTDHCAHWDVDNLTMDIAVHVGTLFAVLLYFWRDVVRMLMGVRDMGTGKFSSDNSKLTLYVIIGSVPVIIAGFVLNIFEPDWLKTLYVIAWSSIVFGIILWWSDRKENSTREVKDLTFKDVIIIGLAQMLALIPGTSRSGITMTAGRMLGFSRKESARYSMLLAMVAISGAGTLMGLSLLDGGNLDLGTDAAIAVIFSFVSGFGALVLMMKFLERYSFTPFVIYRVALGVILLSLLYSGAIA